MVYDRVQIVAPHSQKDDVWPPKLQPLTGFVRVGRDLATVCNHDNAILQVDARGLTNNVTCRTFKLEASLQVVRSSLIFPWIVRDQFKGGLILKTMQSIGSVLLCSTTPSFPNARKQCYSSSSYLLHLLPRFRCLVNELRHLVHHEARHFGLTIAL
jgi:hypothetical protein